MADPQFLRVRNWEEFQYRTDKRLPWIKDYDAQLEDFEYVSLTDSQRGHLHDIRLLANRTRNKIPNDSGWVRAAIRASRAPDLHMLTSKGFLEAWVSDSNMPVIPTDSTLASAHSERTESAISAQEIEKEREREIENKPTAPARLRVADPVWDFVVELEGEPLDRRRAARGRIVKELKQRLNEQDVGEARRRHDALAREWGDAKATARALVEHWDRAGRMADGLMRPAQQQPRADGRVTASDLYATAMPEQPQPPNERRQLDAG